MPNRRRVRIGTFAEPQWELISFAGNNVKGDKASKSAKHAWLRKIYGRPTYCMNSHCDKKCEWYDWAVKKGRAYSHDPNDYLWLCRRCHRKYDMTDELRTKAIVNLANHNKFTNKDSYARHL